jgi:hypothetical protein
LRPVFRESGLEIQAAAVEKVLVLPARRLGFFDRLLELGAVVLSIHQGATQQEQSARYRLERG